MGWLDYARPVPDNTNTVYLMNSHLWPYHRTLAIWRCPADRSTSRHGGRLYPRVRSVSMNGWLGYNSEAWDGPAGLIVYKKLSQMIHPSPADIWVILDEREDSINDGWFACDPNQPNKWVDIPASYHNTAGGLSFADGHAEIKKWFDPHTKKPVTRTRYIPVIEENPDAAWLQERSTSLKQP